ncbi:uncharacterized protein [Prorops nasuta]|uniref:uncharacterized protein n=1 Tax=Prorops nasuta TaxID=863751 RepID=UPI0034D017E3
MRLIEVSFVYLVTLACLTSGILTSSFHPNASRTSSSSSRVFTYIPSTVVAVAKHPAEYVAHASNNGFGSEANSTGSSLSGYSHSGRFHVALRSTKVDPYSRYKQKDHDDIKNQSNFGRENLKNHRLPANWKKGSSEGESKDDQPFKRSSYQVVEEDDINGGPYPGRIESAYSHSSSEDIETAIGTLDRFLSGALNRDGYNSELHPPTNPLLALVLSRYGHYLSGPRNPRIYAYMAVNNIHNHKPFGQYKLQSDEEPDKYR